MVVSGSDTSHSAGRAVCGALASATVPPSANSAAKGAIKRCRSLVIIGSSWGLAVTGATLRIAEAAAKATRTSLNGAYPLEPELPGPDPHAPPLLGRARLRDPPALRHGNGGRDVPPCDDPALARAESVARGLCAAVSAADRRPLR